MENVPWHEEVVKFVKELESRLPDYGLASEHEHSNCLLLAHNKVRAELKSFAFICKLSCDFYHLCSKSKVITAQQLSHNFLGVDHFCFSSLIDTIAIK